MLDRVCEKVYHFVMEMIDVHGHISDSAYEKSEIESVVQRAIDSGVTKMVCSSCDIASSLDAIELSKKFDNVYANVGMHPENVEVADEKSLAQIEELAKDKKVVAIGEIGLDYHWKDDNKELQKEIFVKQIEIANRVKKPIVVHSRDAMGDTIEVLKNHLPNMCGILHCFGGSVESAKILAEMGFSFSIGGVVTFKNAKTIVEVVKSLPLDRIMLETDCPYLSPEPFRGKRNEPKNVVYVADKIAKIKGISIEEVAKISTENAKRLFGI